MEKKKMILIILLVLAIVVFPVKKFLLDNSKQDKTTKSNITNTMNKIIKDVKMVSAETIELNKDNFKDFSFISWEDGIEAVASEGLIGTNAHSMVLIKTKNKDGAKIAKEISQNANSRKWICVGSEIAKVLYTDDYVFLVMTYKDTYNAVKDNFKKVVGEYKTLDVTAKFE